MKNIENTIINFFKDNNYEKSRRFIPNSYSPENLSLFLKEMGNPQNSFNSIHVVGTSGKGSVTHYLSRMLYKKGFKTAAFLSPHLIKINERILVNDLLISDKKLISLFTKIKPFIKKYNLSFFDTLTAMAFLHFKNEKVNWAVIEAGLGGRLDSTNNINARLIVITPIGLDHMNILGKTLNKIAQEKAAVIKPNSIVYSFFQKPPVKKIIEEKVNREKTSLKYFNIRNCKSYLETNYKICEKIFFHFFNQKPPLVDIKIPGRLEILNEDPIVIFDCAHNDIAANELGRYIKKNYTNLKIHVYINCLKERNIFSIIKSFQKAVNSKYIQDIFLIHIENESQFYTLYDINTLNNNHKIKLSSIEDIHDIKNIIHKYNKSLHIIFGSMRLYADIKYLFK
ncbi:MAG: Mur ligase family protein [Spirochaetia bacterium]|nr:Mur ligase family protein [Spirochaetia bacterium]